MLTYVVHKPHETILMFYLPGVMRGPARFRHSSSLKRSTSQRMAGTAAVTQFSRCSIYTS